MPQDKRKSQVLCARTPAELADTVRASARAAGVSVSSVLRDALKARVGVSAAVQSEVVNTLVDAVEQGHDLAEVAGVLCEGASKSEASYITEVALQLEEAVTGPSVPGAPKWLTGKGFTLFEQAVLDQLADAKSEADVKEIQRLGVEGAVNDKDERWVKKACREAVAMLQQAIAAQKKAAKAPKVKVEPPAPRVRKAKAIPDAPPPKALPRAKALPAARPKFVLSKTGKALAAQRKQEKAKKAAATAKRARPSADLSKPLQKALIFYPTGNKKHSGAIEIYVPHKATLRQIIAQATKETGIQFARRQSKGPTEIQTDEGIFYRGGKTLYTSDGQPSPEIEFKTWEELETSEFTEAEKRFKATPATAPEKTEAKEAPKKVETKPKEEKRGSPYKATIQPQIEGTKTVAELAEVRARLLREAKGPVQKATVEKLHTLHLAHLNQQPPPPKEAPETKKELAKRIKHYKADVAKMTDDDIGFDVARIKAQYPTMSKQGQATAETFLTILADEETKRLKLRSDHKEARDGRKATIAKKKKAREAKETPAPPKPQRKKLQLKPLAAGQKRPTGAPREHYLPRPEKKEMLRGATCSIAAPVLLGSKKHGGLEKIPAHYCLVSAAELLTSNQPETGFGKTPGYPSDAQERDYQRNVLEQEKVRQMARALEPELIFNTNPGALDGPPVVNQDRIVLGGNGRTMAVKLVYEPNNRQASQNLERFLRKVAPNFGFRASDVDKVPFPMFVRTIQTSDDPKEWATLSRRLNESLSQELDTTGLAVSRARFVSARTLEELYTLPTDETLNAWLQTSASLGFVRKLQSDGIIDTRNAATMLHEGLLSAKGREMVQDVLVAVLVPDAALIKALGPGTVGTLATSAPYLVQVRSMGTFNVLGTFPAALQNIVSMRRNNYRDAEQFLRQLPLGETPPSPIQALWVRILDSLGQSSVKFKKMVKRYLELVQKEAGGEMVLFASESLSPYAALAKAAQEQGVTLESPKPSTPKPTTYQFSGAVRTEASAGPDESVLDVARRAYAKAYPQLKVIDVKQRNSSYDNGKTLYQFEGKYFNDKKRFEAIEK